MTVVTMLCYEPEGKYRIQGERVSMGAYETNSEGK